LLADPYFVPQSFSLTLSCLSPFLSGRIGRKREDQGGTETRWNADKCKPFQMVEGQAGRIGRIGSYFPITHMNSGFRPTLQPPMKASHIRNAEIAP
jgi:hypothetical protein